MDLWVRTGVDSNAHADLTECVYSMPTHLPLTPDANLTLSLGMPQYRKSCPCVLPNVPTDPYHYLQPHPLLISPNTFFNLI